MLKLDSRGETVRTLQENLAVLGYRPGPADGVFGEKTEDAVILFQEAEGLYADGIAGPQTLQALDEALRNHLLEMHGLGESSGEAAPQRLPFVRVPADKYRDGYDRFFLREDAAAAYMQVREEVVEAGGRLTSSGARRALSARVSPSRSATSFHYTGRALDLHVGSGMESPARDPFVITRDGDRYWRVFVRAPGGQVMDLEALTYGSRRRSRQARGKFLDLTALLEQAGFGRIRARKSFFNGGTWLGAEWWHFQYEKGLVPQVSSFGEELLRVYDRQTLEGTPPWRFRDRVFRVNWG